jgi:ABC-type multidrug transport system fused ATPase/permease subunit
MKNPTLFCLNILNPTMRLKLATLTLIQIFVGLADLIALGLSGVLVAGTFSANQEDNNSSGIGAMIVRIPIFGRLLDKSDHFMLVCLILSLLIFKTLFSAFFTRYVMRYLSEVGADITKDNVRKLLNSPILVINKQSSQEIVFSLTKGIESIVMFVIANLFIMVSDIILLFMLVLGLFFLDTFMALISLLLFTFFGSFLMKYMHLRSMNIGSENTRLNVESNREIIDLINSYREIVVGGRKHEYVAMIGQQRRAVSRSFAELTFLPYVSKYAIEVGVVVGAAAIAGLTYLYKNGEFVLSTIALFLVAATRIAPAALRIQQGWISMRSNIGSAEPSLLLINQLSKQSDSSPPQEITDFTYKNFEPSISISDLEFTYQGKKIPAIKRLNLVIEAGTMNAFVGPSGGGKSTLLDLVFGILLPDSGEVRISGESPHGAISKWPGAIGFVPQNSTIHGKSIAENIALGVNPKKIDKVRVWEALEIAGLQSFVEGLSQGLETVMEENGTNLSGGQRQRLGIARALYTKPKILVLDEATSALDVTTESIITEALLKMRGEVTLIVIAHRLSTVINADVINYIVNGEIQASGDFVKLQELVPEFAAQVKTSRY